MQYFIGALVLVAGVGMVMKTEWIVQNFGASAWAEQHLGTSGGTRLMYKFIGLALIFFGFLVVTNLQEQFLTATLGKIFIF